MYGYAIAPYKNEAIESFRLGHIFKLVSRFDVQARTVNRFHSLRRKLSPILNAQRIRCMIATRITIRRVALRRRVLLRRLALRKLAKHVQEHK